MQLGEVMTVAVVFFAIITFVKVLSAHFLKSKIIKSGHFDKAGILEQSAEVVEAQRTVSYDQYPALKWGLVTFFGGIGLIIIELVGVSNPVFSDYNSTMPFGIFFVSVAVGFLVYYFMMSAKMKK
ncbi:MAG: hypothetical protein PF484_02620 [Bacteroidales bacterium]|jgi:hypothetical protein|nr:hypothetical protein [Bacteroidales bacterium]